MLSKLLVTVIAPEGERRKAVPQTRTVPENCTAEDRNCDALQIGGEYHRYHSDVGGIKFGKELDIGVSYAFTKKLAGKVEYADFREGDIVAAQRRRDTTKIWFTLTYNH